MRRICFLVFCWLVAFSGLSAAEEVTQCRKIHRVDGRVYTVKAAISKAAHIILPEPVTGKPVNGNIDLWEAASKGNHLFIKPTSTAKAGDETSITVIGVSNTSYDFRAVRSDDVDFCIQIENDGPLIAGTGEVQNTVQEASWTPQNFKENEELRGELAKAQEEILAAQNRTRGEIEAAMMEYRSFIYTRYKWGTGSGFMGRDIVSDVWDDGRWTYVRVKADNKGLLTTAALIDGKKELVEYQYDAGNKIYKIVGIYPELFLKYGESEITVERDDNRTAGAF